MKRSNIILALVAVFATGVLVGYTMQTTRTEIVKSGFQHDQPGSFKHSKESVPGPSRLTHPPERQSSKDDEARMTESLIALRDRGDYLLESEWPAQQQHAALLVGKAVAQAMAEKGHDYYAKFSEFGVSGVKASQLVGHIGKIHKASIQAELALQEIELARLDYDKRLRSELSEDDYRAYREFEAAKKTNKELESFQIFASENQNLTVDQGHREILAKLIQKAGAYSQSYDWHGPYDSLPQPKVGKENVVNGLNQRRNELSHAAMTLLEEAKRANVPQEYILALQGYYAEGINGIDATIQNVNEAEAKNRQRMLEIQASIEASRGAVGRNKKP